MLEGSSRGPAAASAGVEITLQHSGTHAGFAAIDAFPGPAHLNWGGRGCWDTVLCLSPLPDPWGTADPQTLGTSLLQPLCHRSSACKLPLEVNLGMPEELSAAPGISLRLQTARGGREAAVDGVCTLPVCFRNYFVATRVVKHWESGAWGSGGVSVPGGI